MWGDSSDFPGTDHLYFLCIWQYEYGHGNEPWYRRFYCKTIWSGCADCQDSGNPAPYLSFGTPGNVLEHKGAVLNPSRCTLTWNGHDIDLTKNELRILEILLEHAGKAVSRDAIMTKLWESDSFVDDNTLTVNITRLRKNWKGKGWKTYHHQKGLGYMV